MDNVFVEQMKWLDPFEGRGYSFGHLQHSNLPVLQTLQQLHNPALHKNFL